MHGVFRATSDGYFNREDKVFAGRYPYQVKVEPLGNITKIQKANTVLAKLDASKRNTPLFGKTIPDILRHTILERNVENIYISLDSDARQSISRHIQTFMGEGRSVYFVDLPVTKDVKYDPSKLGFEKMRGLIDSAQRATLKTIVQLRMS